MPRRCGQLFELDVNIVFLRSIGDTSEDGILFRVDMIERFGYAGNCG